MTSRRAGVCSAQRRICSARTASTPPASTPSSTKPAPQRPRSTNCSARKPISCMPCWRVKASNGANGSSARWKQGGGDAQTKLTRIFPALKSWFGEDRFYGCPFINAVGEHDKDQKQFRNIAMRHKKVVLAHIEKLAGEMGAAEPASAGASARAVDRWRDRGRDGVARSRGGGYGGNGGRESVWAGEGEEAEARRRRAGG